MIGQKYLLIIRPVATLGLLQFITDRSKAVVLLAHLSRRLKGELIVYQSSCRLCVCVSVCKHFQT